MVLIEYVRKFIYHRNIALKLIKVTFDTTELNGWFQLGKSTCRTAKKALLVRFCEQQ